MRLVQGLSHDWIIVTTAGATLASTPGPLGCLGQFLHQRRDGCGRGSFFPYRITWIVCSPEGLQHCGSSSFSLAFVSGCFRLGW